MFERFSQTSEEQTDGRHVASHDSCLLVNRAYQRIVVENLQRIELLLEHNRFKQVCCLALTSNLIHMYLNVSSKCYAY